MQSIYTQWFRGSTSLIDLVEKNPKNNCGKETEIVLAREESIVWSSTPIDGYGSCSWRQERFATDSQDSFFVRRLRFNEICNQRQRYY